MPLPPEVPPTATGASPPPLRVVTTVLPVELFTRAVVGSCARVEPLLSAGADPHQLPVSPQLMARLQGADVVVLNGLGLEASLQQLLTANGGRGPRRIEAAAGIAPLPQAPQDGDHHHADAHGHAANPHVWLDPRRAAAQVRTIRAGLVAADPARAACFRGNADRFLSELERLDRDLARQLAPFAGRPILSFHDLAPYFAQRYGLRSVSLVEGPEENPSVADLQRLAAQLRSQRVQGLLVDPQNERRSFLALADDLRLKRLPFDPIERASEAQARRPDHYLEAMRRNGAAVVSSFGPAN
ncbi:MAG: zinc ABC transporter substrate-binding protein, partial [Synechococcaceae cyanobacterium]|nr:zinc ABC transporter substrate-binding protein [Synechococcaceae cyanobacterium]